MLDKSDLTLRELEIMSLFAQGLTGLVIAQRLDISKRTVDTHVMNAKRKVGVKNVTELACYLLRHNLIQYN